MPKPEIYTSRDARRRWFGSLFLILAVGMIVWGQTILKSTLGTHPVAFILYWIGCFGFTGLALIVALIDIWVMRGRSQDAHRALFKKTFVRTEEEEDDPT